MIINQYDMKLSDTTAFHVLVEKLGSEKYSASLTYTGEYFSGHEVIARKMFTSQKEAEKEMKALITWIVNRLLVLHDKIGEK